MAKATTVGMDEIARQVAKHSGVTQAAARLVIDTAFNEILASARKGAKVRTGLGIFAVKHRAARNGRNPATGKTMKIPASRSLGFRPSKATKDSL